MFKKIKNAQSNKLGSSNLEEHDAAISRVSWYNKDNNVHISLSLNIVNVHIMLKMYETKVGLKRFERGYTHL